MSASENRGPFPAKGVPRFLLPNRSSFSLFSVWPRPWCLKPHCYHRCAQPYYCSQKSAWKIDTRVPPPCSHVSVFTTIYVGPHSLHSLFSLHSLATELSQMPNSLVQWSSLHSSASPPPHDSRIWRFSLLPAELEVAQLWFPWLPHSPGVVALPQSTTLFLDHFLYPNVSS